MAEEPPSGTEAISQFDAAKKEVTATAGAQADVSEIPEPSRPKQHPGANVQPDGPGTMNQMDRAALARNRQLNEPYADHNARLEVQQAAQSSPGSNAWAKQIAEDAKEREEANARAKEQDKGHGR